jgi:hypothetical protein
VVSHSRRFLRLKSSASNQSVLDVFEFLAPVCVPVSSSSPFHGAAATAAAAVVPGWSFFS